MHRPLPGRLPDRSVAGPWRKRWSTSSSCSASLTRPDATREKTCLEHAWEIRHEYGFAEFSDRRHELEEWLWAQVWTTTDGPKALFDGASAWLRGRGVLLPGVTVLARLVSQIRDEVTGQLWRALCELIAPV